jgi:quercetin dioxygenase-like cupin family protein
LRARILERARNATQTDSSPHQTVRDEEGDWQEIAPLVEMKVLFRNAQAEAIMYRLHPGAELPGHEHPTDEECMMLEGEMWIGDLRLRAGDFHFGCQGVGHAGIHSPQGALLYVRRGILAGAA